MLPSKHVTRLLQCSMTAAQLYNFANHAVAIVIEQYLSAGQKVSAHVGVSFIHRTVWSPAGFLHTSCAGAGKHCLAKSRDAGLVPVMAGQVAGLLASRIKT